MLSMNHIRTGDSNAMGDADSIAEDASLPGQMRPPSYGFLGIGPVQGTPMTITHRNTGDSIPKTRLKPCETNVEPQSDEEDGLQDDLDEFAGAVIGNTLPMKQNLSPGESDFEVQMFGGKYDYIYHPTRLFYCPSSDMDYVMCVCKNLIDFRPTSSSILRRSSGPRDEVRPMHGVSWILNLKDDQPLTLMVRNLPCRINQERMEEELALRGFGGKYDYIYFPTRPNKSGRGFGFVNFHNTIEAYRFIDTFVGYTFENTASSKRCYVSIADVQGKDASLAMFSSGGPRKRDRALARKTRGVRKGQDERPQVETEP